jgi:hypothetical protein
MSAATILLRAAGGAFILTSAAYAQSGTPLRLKPERSADTWQLGLKAILISVLFLGIVAALLYGWRVWRRGQVTVAGTGATVQLESARRVSPRTLLLTVQWQGKQYLLAENAGQTCVIDSRELERANT